MLSLGLDYYIDMHTEIKSFIEKILEVEISEARKKEIQPFVDYLRAKLEKEEFIHLNFICTHNSRRSHMAQILGELAAHYFQLPIRTYSGGVEVTSFYPGAVAAFERAGFTSMSKGDSNPIYFLSYSETKHPTICFSKKYDDPFNPEEKFAAVMVCGSAEKNCPFISGAEKRVSVSFEDPKEFDGLPHEEQAYDDKLLEIGSQLFYCMRESSN